MWEKDGAPHTETLFKRAGPIPSSKMLTFFRYIVCSLLDSVQPHVSMVCLHFDAILHSISSCSADSCHSSEGQQAQMFYCQHGSNLHGRPQNRAISSRRLESVICYQDCANVAWLSLVFHRYSFGSAILWSVLNAGSCMAPDAGKQVDASQAIQLLAFRTDYGIIALAVDSYLALHTCWLFWLAVSQLAFFIMLTRWGQVLVKCHQLHPGQSV